MPLQQITKSAQDPSVLSVWESQVAQAARNPKLRKQLLQREGELLPRFAEHYRKLKALPRRARRSLQHKWKQSLAGVALLMTFGQGPALAATITVNTNTPDIAANGQCSLIEAIVNANDNAATHPDCRAGEREDTIVLPRNSTQRLTSVNNTNRGPNGLPVITTRITIFGNGSTIERTRAQGTPEFRIFQVGNEDDEGTLTLNQTTVTGGGITGRGGNFEKAGGSILNYYGRLTIFNSTISGNFATYGGGVYNEDILDITASTVSGNHADYSGGGVQNDGTLTITTSTISDNDTAYSGGGVRNYDNGELTITNSTISGNTANNFGGGLYNQSFTTLINSTISGNFADVGGGIFNGRNRYLYLDATLVSGNSADDGAEIYASEARHVYASDFNLFGRKELTTVEATVGFTPEGSDITATSDGKRPTALGAILNTKLANNRGLTLTHALVDGSPAVDVVQTGCPPPNTDQRNIQRPQGNRCDIGAFELVPPPDRDRDGVADVDDRCPDRPGPASNNGCPVPPPDRDRDGVADVDDRCPDRPGPASNNGCPPPPPPPPPSTGDLSATMIFDLGGTQPSQVQLCAAGMLVSSPIADGGRTTFSNECTQLQSLAPGPARSLFIRVPGLQRGSWRVSAQVPFTTAPVTCPGNVPGFVTLDVSGGRGPSCR